MENSRNRNVSSGSGAHAGSAARFPSILIDQNDIRRRVQDLGAQITAHYKELQEPLVLLIVLDGAMVFAADLMRQLKIPFEIATIKCKSYQDGKNSGSLKITHDQDQDLRQRQILIVEDIIDSGVTIRRLIRRLPLNHAPGVVTLLQRQGQDNGHPDWVGFKLPQGFVFGYGLDDADGTRRGLKDIWQEGLD